MNNHVNILFLDDELRVLHSLRSLFRRLYRVYIATDGDEALELIKTHNFHVVVSDQRMPNMSGVEFLKQVKAISPVSMRLLLTGYSDLTAIVDSINEGEVFRFINKPWDNDKIREVVALAVDASLETSDYYQNNVLDQAEIISEKSTSPNAEVALSVHSNSTPQAIPTPKTPILSPLPKISVLPERTTSLSEEVFQTFEKPKPTINTHPHFPVLLLLDYEKQLIPVIENNKEIQMYDLVFHHCNQLDEAMTVLETREVAVVILAVHIEDKATMTSFLKVLKQQHPLIVTIVVSDVRDVDMAIELINQGQVFRFFYPPVRSTPIGLATKAAFGLYLKNKKQTRLLKRHQVERSSNHSLSAKLLQRLQEFGRRLKVS